MLKKAYLVLSALGLLATTVSAVQGQGPAEENTPEEVALDEIEVVASHSILREDPVAPVALSREQIERPPHFGDDLFRAIAILPGTSGGDISAAFNVRGGFFQETLTRIDGIEIFEPFHLKDFQGIFSILDPKITGGVDLTPGGYPAEYGDRMTGVLDMTTVQPTALKTELGASFSNLWAGTAGTFAGGKGRWVGSIRRGFLDLVLALASDDEGSDDDQPSPRYWDLFGKVDYDLTPSQTLGFRVLGSEDTLSLEEIEDGDYAVADTAYGNQYVWVTHQGILSSRAFVDSALSAGTLNRNRSIEVTEADETEFFLVHDERDTRTYTLRQDWNYELSQRQYIKWGFELRSYNADYDYVDRALLQDPIDDPRFLPGRRETEFADTFSGSSYSVYAADRFRLHPRFTTEIGVRWDRQTLTEEDELSPRVNLVYDLSSRGVIRAGWGYYYQSQRPYELRVEFSETEFQQAQRAEHLTLGYERQIGSGYRLRADAYQRTITDPQVRYETLFDPFNVLPEARIDLIAIPAESAESVGLELLIRSPSRPKVNWWLGYTLSDVTDRAEGIDVARSIDQTHAVTAVASWRPATKWSLTWVWSYHTGWPTTPVTAELRYDPVDGQFIDYNVGRFYSERLDDYFRLDFRASRTSRLGPGELTLFVDIRNLFDRENPRGIAIVDPEYRPRPDGSIEVVFPTEYWLPLLPSFGVSYSF